MSQRLKACDRCCGRGQSFREQQQNLREQEAGGLACLCLARTHVADDGKINILSHVMEEYSESCFSTLLEHVTTLHR